MTMAVTQDDIDALELAIASGASQVKYRDRTVEYRSLADMRNTLDMLQRKLDADNGLSNGGRRPRTWGAYSTKAT